MMNYKHFLRTFRFSWFDLPKVTEIVIDNAPDFMLPVRALFISDVHLRRSVSQERLDRLIALIRSQSADLLLLGGDYGEGRSQCERFFNALADLSFPLGIYAVPGNNDVRNDLDLLLRPANAVLLRNRAVDIPLTGGVLRIGGVDDHKYGQPDARGLFPDDAAYRILLSHFPVNCDCPCDLQLSGHTHAGQICPFKITPYDIGFERRYHMSNVSGLDRVDHHQIFVSSGIGVSRLPIRLNADPEICLLSFRK